MINEHLYYALKYFCNSKVLRNTEDKEWGTLNGFCKFRVNNGRKYPIKQEFTYHYLSLDNPLRIIDNYTTRQLKDHLLYKRYQ